MADLLDTRRYTRFSRVATFVLTGGYECGKAIYNPNDSEYCNIDAKETPINDFGNILTSKRYPLVLPTLIVNTQIGLPKNTFEHGKLQGAQKWLISLRCFAICHISRAALMRGKVDGRHTTTT